jgi:hypothetical protein
MLIVSVLTFFVVIFLLAAITVTVAWMGFLKSRSEVADVSRGGPEIPYPGDPGDPDQPGDPELAGIQRFDEESHLFRSERLSTLNFWTRCSPASISPKFYGRGSPRRIWIGRWVA